MQHCEFPLPLTIHLPAHSHFKFKEMAATVQMLVNLVDHGHRIAHLGRWMGTAA
jgi:hypothetical protein